MLATASPALAQTPPPPEEALLKDPSARHAQAQEAYQRAEYTKLRPLLEPMLEPKSLFKDPQERIEARTLLAAGAFFEAQSTRDAQERDALLALARAQLLALLREKPDHNLDTLVYPVSFIDLFEEVRALNREELDRLRAKQNEQSGINTGQSHSEPIYIERAVNQHQFALNFAPFGFGQFQNEQPAKGTFFAVAQGLALTVNVISYFAILNLRGTDSSDAYYDTGADGFSGNYATALTWRNVMYGSLATFGALYTWSVVDGLYYYQPEALRHLKTLDGPPPELSPSRGPNTRQSAPLGPSIYLNWRSSF